jgi:Ase1/PRC1/MAP65 family protein
MLTLWLYQLFSALSETLNNQVRQVTAEKKDMIEEANRTIIVIRQMESSLDDANSSRSSRSSRSSDGLKITYPLTRCLAALKEKHGQVARLHRERFEQIKSMFQSHSMIPWLCATCRPLANPRL